MVTYKLYWIPMDGKYILPTKKKLMGIYASKSACRLASAEMRRHLHLKGEEGAYFMNEKGTSIFDMV